MASLGNRFSLTCSYPRTQPQPRHSWAIYSRERKAYVHAVTYTHMSIAVLFKIAPNWETTQLSYKGWMATIVEHTYCVIHSMTEMNYLLKHAVTSMDLHRIRQMKSKWVSRGYSAVKCVIQTVLGWEINGREIRLGAMRGWGVGGVGGAWVWLWTFTWGSSVMVGTFCTLMYQCQHPGCDTVNSFARC